MRKFVKVVAIIVTVFAVIGFIVLCVQLGNRRITWETFLIETIGGTINILLLWALYVALDKIETLEKKVNNLENKLHKKGIIEKDKEVHS